MRRLWAFMALILCGSIAVADETADRIWFGGTILTMHDGAMRAEAVAERDGRIIAVGAEEYKPTEYLYGEDDRVLTQLELGDQLVREDGKLADARSLVMIQCVGCRQPDRNYCARICCNQSIKNALKLKEKNPQMVQPLRWKFINRCRYIYRCHAAIGIIGQ